MCEALFNRITEAILNGIKIRLKLKLQKPCPFGSGLRKFALDFVVVVFFFQICRKKYMWWFGFGHRKNWFDLRL